MGHQALAIVQALGFGHGEPGIQQIFQTTDVEIHDAGIPLGVLAHVAAEPDGLAVFHLGDGSLLQLFDGQVEVAHCAALFHVAQVLHGVAAAVGLILGGSIDEADIVAQVNAHILFKEALGGQPLFTVEVVALIAVLKGKGLGRLAQADAEQALSLTAQLMTDEFANALEVKNSAGTSETGEMVTPLLRSGNSHLWLHFSATDWSGTGIEKWYGDYTYDDAYNKIPLLTQAAISDEYYTAFDGYTYSEETACFTVQNLAIYRKKDTMGTSRKAVVKPINLIVRAVNLDQK